MTATIEELADELAHIDRDARALGQERTPVALAAGLIARAIAVSASVNLAGLADRQAHEARFTQEAAEGREVLLRRLEAAIAAADALPVTLARLEAIEAALDAAPIEIRAAYLRAGGTLRG